MQVGDLVSVKTRHYGTKLGVLVKSYNRPDWRGGEWRVHLLANPLPVVHAAGCDIEVISESR